MRQPQSNILAGRYELLRRLGEGGYGAVYEAFDNEWQTRVALKTLQRMEPDAILRFKEEFRALQDVEHPNLVHLGELTCSDGLWFFTMELVEGTDFYDYVRPLLSKVSYLGIRELDEARLRQALAQLVDALLAVHQSGRVHCDIKPTNIRVDHSGRLVLLDFGLVTAVSGGGVDVSLEPVLGTPGYMAPEQCRGEPITEATDWYGVGVLIYEALTGMLPFSGSASHVLLEKQLRLPVEPREYAPQAPADLAELCMALLHPQPSERPEGAKIWRAVHSSRAGTPPHPGTVQASGISEIAPFVGRAAERAWLSHVLETTRGGHAAFVYVSGESGVGKSALVQRVAREAHQHDNALVLRGRCYERETVPYKAFDGIVDDLARHLSVLPPEVCRELLPGDAKLLLQVFPVLSRAPGMSELPLGSIPQDPYVLRSHAFAALREILARLALERPLLLIMDDLQWTDLDSLLLLEELIQAPEAPACLVLATGRPLSHLAKTLSDVLVPLLVSDCCAELPLTGLAEDDAKELARTLAHGALDDELLTRIAREAKGHPLFVAELLRDFQAGRVLDPSRHLDAALLERVEQLEAPTRVLLETLAVASGPTAHGVLAYALHQDPTELGRRLAQLRASHLARSEDRLHSECYHDRVRLAVLSALAPAQKLHRHRALAEAFSAQGDAEAEQAAYQWACAGERSRAARYAAQAADAATRALAFNRAAQLYQQALAESAAFDPARLFDLRVSYANALSCAGFTGRAAEAYLEASAGCDEEQARSLRRRAAQLMLRSGRIQEGLALADAVLADVGLSRPTTPTRAVFRLAWERARLSVRGLDIKSSEAESEARAELLELLWAVAPSLAFVDILGGSALQTLYARLALSSGDVQHVVRSLTMEACSRSSMGTPPQNRVIRILQQVRSAAEGSDSPYLRALVWMSHGYVHWVNFRLPDAVSALAQAEKLFREKCLDVAWELTNTRAALLNSLWNMGRLGQHAELAREWQRDARDRGDRYAEIQLLCMGLGYNPALVSGDAALAEKQLQDSLQGLPDVFQLPQWSQFIGRLLVELYKQDGAPHALLTEYWPRVRRSQLLRASYLRELTYVDAAWACLHQCARSAPEQSFDLQTEALHHARKLAETRRPLADELSRQIRGQVHVFTNERALAVEVLSQAESGLREHQSVYQYPTAYLIGRLLGQPQGNVYLKRALDWASREGISDPDRWFAAFAPALRALV